MEIRALENSRQALIAFRQKGRIALDGGNIKCHPAFHAVNLPEIEAIPKIPVRQNRIGKGF